MIRKPLHDKEPTASSKDRKSIKHRGGASEQSIAVLEQINSGQNDLLTAQQR
jgi:hypothetical protein